MKKVYLIVFALLLVGAFSAQAQFKFGVKAGANFSKFTSTDPDLQAENLTAWHGGIMAEYKMSSFGIEADVLYTQNGSKFDVLGATQELKNTYVAIPVVAKVYFAKVLNIQAGPQFSFLTSSELDIDGIKEDFKDQLESSDLQIVFGAGVELAMFHASLRYNLGVKDINADTASSFDLKNNAFMLSVGIWLKK